MTLPPAPAPVHQSVAGDGNAFSVHGNVELVQNRNYIFAPGDLEKLQRLRELRRAVRTRLDNELRTSLAGGAMLPLGMEEMPNAVAPLTGRFMDLRDGTRHAVDTSTSLLRMYEKAEQKLLVLGEPGSGKSTMLTELARALLPSEAEQDDRKLVPVGLDDARPVPVVLYLTRWGRIEAERDMAAWVAAEMASQYHARHESVREWLKDSRLFLLLDGLDEVALERRAACVGAINSFLKEGLPALCVSCRLREYDELPQVELFGAVRLQRLTDLQVSQHIDAEGPKLAGFGEALGRDAELREAARSPLMLRLLSQIYEDAPVEQVELSTPATPQERQAHALYKYVKRIFHRGESGEPTREEQQTRQWLHHLAREMKARSQTVFLLEELQPDWLPDRASRAAYALASRAVIGVVLFLPLSYIGPVELLAVGATGACVGVLDARRFASNPPVHVSEPSALRGMLRVAGYVVLSVTIGSLFAFAVFQSEANSWAGGLSFFGGLVLGLFFGLRSAPGRTTRDIQTRETMRWSWKGMAKGAGISFLACVLLPTVGVLLLAKKVDREIVLDLISWALHMMILGALIGGFKSRAVEARLKLSEVNEGIKLSLKNARRVLVIGTIAFGCVLAGITSQVPLEGSLSLKLIAVPLVSALVGASIAWFPAMWFGGADVIQHFVLRLMLTAKGVVPWRLARFLDRGLSLGFLKRIGGGYGFVHRPLLEHFADERFVERSDDQAGPRRPDAREPR